MCCTTAYLSRFCVSPITLTGLQPATTFTRAFHFFFSFPFHLLPLPSLEMMMARPLAIFTLLASLSFSFLPVLPSPSLFHLEVRGFRSLLRAFADAADAAADAIVGWKKKLPLLPADTEAPSLPPPPLPPSVVMVAWKMDGFFAGRRGRRRLSSLLLVMGLNLLFLHSSSYINYGTYIHG